MKDHDADRRIEIARAVESVIDKGASSAEEIHRAVGELPLAVLENIGLPNAAAGCRKIQDRSISVLYQFIRDINHQAAEVATALLKRDQDDPGQGRED